MSAIEASKAAAGLAAAIVGVPSVNAAIGFDPEARARRSLIRLRNLTVPRAVVRRDGQTIDIPAAEMRARVTRHGPRRQ